MYVVIHLLAVGKGGEEGRYRILIPYDTYDRFVFLCFQTVLT